MRLEDARTLQALADARYKARQQRFQALLQRENAVRADLRKLDAQARSSETRLNDDMRSIGGDVIWQAWLGKSKRALNMQLALILAEKDQHLHQVRQAYGKVLASEYIVKDMLGQQRADRRKACLDRAIDMSLANQTRSRSS